MGQVHRQLTAAGWINAMALPASMGGGGGVQQTIDSVGLGSGVIDHIYVSGTCSRRSRLELAGACVVRSDGFRSDEEADAVHSDHLPVVVTLQSEATTATSKL